jgi:CRISPR-associated protein Cas1
MSLPGPRLDRFLPGGSDVSQLPSSDSHAPSLRVESLHALAYCRRLYYLQEVERISVPHERLYAGRHLHAALEDNEDGETVAIELESQTLGLVGKADCVRRRDGTHLPYEHKRGRPARAPDNSPEPWPSDRLQIVAYAALLEESFGQPVPEGRIRYHAVNATVRVPIDDKARADLLGAIHEARRLRESLDRPGITDNARLCEKCSLAPACLPEEVRHDRDPARDPIRLFPPDRDGTTLHVVRQGTSVGISADSIVLKSRDEPETKLPARGIDTVLLHGFNQISTQAIRKCVEHGISVHWLSVSGYHTASLVPTAGQVQRRVRQYQALSDEATCLRLSRQLAAAKVEGQYRYLMRASRGDNEARTLIHRALKGIKPLLAGISACSSRDALRGLEGSAAVHYFTALRQLLGPQVDTELRADNRSRRPPRDRFNALLSYGYGLLLTAVMRGLLASGLEPALGFFYTPRSAAYPLALDVMELFRVPLWDMPLVGSLNRGQWDPVADFAATPAKVWLSETGRKKAIGLFEARLQETWKHPVLNYSLSYARTIELEARLLEKEWTGEPGLFARSRLR